MSDNKIEINKEIARELFKLADLPVPTHFSDEAFFECVFKLKSKIETKGDAMMNGGFEAGIRETNNILVVDDIGIVTYQLKLLLRNLGYNVHVAKDIFGALNTFIKNKYDYIIMDLFVSTEQEGYTLLNETKKLITKNNLNTKIVVITASNKTENKVKCLNGGADMFIKKDTGWQDRLVEMIENQSMEMEEETEQ